jgi:hypothetical protein
MYNVYSTYCNYWRISLLANNNNWLSLYSHEASFLVDLKKTYFLKDFFPLNSQRQRWMNLLFFLEVYCTSTSVPRKLYGIQCTENSRRGAVSSIPIRCKVYPPSPFPLLAGKSAICGVNNVPKLGQEIRVFSPCHHSFPGRHRVAI